MPTLRPSSARLRQTKLPSPNRLQDESKGNTRRLRPIAPPEANTVPAMNQSNGKGNTRRLRARDQVKPNTSPIKGVSPRVSRRRTTRSSPIKRSKVGPSRKRGKFVIPDSEDESSSKSKTETEDSDNDGKFQGVNVKKQSTIIIFSDSEEDDIVDTQPAELEASSDGGIASSPPIKSSASKRTNRRVISDEDDDTDETDVVRPLRASHNRIPSESLSPSDSDSDVVVHRGSKRKRLIRSDEIDESEEDIDEEEELRAEVDDLRTSSLINTPVKESKKKRASDALEDFRRRKAREAAGGKFFSSDEDEVEDEESDGYNLENDYRRQGQGETGDLDEYDDDFIDDENVEEDAEEIHAAIPTMFTHWASADPEQLFSHAIEWLIQNEINPGFERNTDLYRSMWRKLNDEIKGMAVSKFKSSVWARDFFVSLETRPLLEGGKQPYDFEESTHCQACKRSGHTATYKITLTGKPYDPETLEELEQDEDDDEEDSKGRKVPDIREWWLGSNCYQNALNAHILEHWKYTLNLAVMDELERSGHMSEAKIVQRSKWTVPKKTKYTQTIMEEWETNGMNKQLWKMYEDFLVTARIDKKGSGYH
jgi:Domain of unknown function (DUF4211)